MNSSDVKFNNILANTRILKKKTFLLFHQYLYYDIDNILLLNDFSLNLTVRSVVTLQTVILSYFLLRFTPPKIIFFLTKIM